MKIVALEGIDACGKGTLCQKLANWFHDDGDNSRILKFPDYGETTTGRLIRSWLGEEWTTGDPLRDAAIHQCLQTVNRSEQLAQLEQESAYEYLLLDRYSPSALAYGQEDGLPRSWLEKINSTLPAPDLLIFLDISVDTSFKRRPVREDRYEKKRDALARIRTNYWNYFDRSDKRYHIVDAERPVRDVLRDVVAIIKNS